VRRMFDLADTSSCLWRGLASHFAEFIAACGDSCGRCAQLDILIAAPPVTGSNGHRRRPTEKSAFEAASDGTASAPARDLPDPELFERLRSLRKKLADQRKVPAYVVFSDRSLQDMASRRPQNYQELLAVHGVGQKKLAEYGQPFLAEIRKGP
jgi:ATP-dependent DNA helicase RecQ